MQLIRIILARTPMKVGTITIRKNGTYKKTPLGWRRVPTSKRGMERDHRADRVRNKRVGKRSALKHASDAKNSIRQALKQGKW